MEKPIYLDFNGSTPLSREVVDAMKSVLDSGLGTGNPSSSHFYGAESKKAIEAARKQVAAALHCAEDELIFTSGGTESNNYAIKGYFAANKGRGNHIISSTVEHPAVTQVCDFLAETAGARVSYCPVDGTGRLDLAALEALITPATILISVMHANNEVGTLQPIREIVEIAKRGGRNIAVHTDASQSVGKVPVRVDELGVDMLTVAGHKLCAPKGIGAVYTGRGTAVERQMHGGDHELKRRAGTENVLYAVALGTAAAAAARDLEKNMAHCRRTRDRLLARFKEAGLDIRVNGHPEHCLPNTLSVGFGRIEAPTLLSELAASVSASAGAACHSDHKDMSGVLKAMKVPAVYGMGTVRFSTGATTTEEEVDRAAALVVAAVRRLTPGEEAGAGDGEGEGGPEGLPALADVRMTRYTKGMGCACKLKPQLLEGVLRGLPRATDPRVLVSTETSDDAAVYKISDELAAVHTLDFFTPVCDDPYEFGAVAAANAISDVYAMGATPATALSIVAFPSLRLPITALQRILQGAADKCAEAGVSIVGGHSIDDPEPKFGLSVTGYGHPERILRNSSARAGDVVVLTKPIGTGVLTTATKRGVASAEEAAACAMAAVGPAVHAATDVTGFGLAGRRARLGGRALLPGAFAHAAAGIVPGGTVSNMEYAGRWVRWGDGVGETTRALLCDAQTSGGLLLAESAEALLAALRERKTLAAAAVARLTAPGPGIITVR
eukprot:tig00021493_g21891.t1